MERPPCGLYLSSVLYAAIAVTVGCYPPDPGDGRTVIAANEEYTVTAVGRLDRPNVTNTFEVTKRGQPYVTDAYLHADSDSFEDESPIQQWVASNALYIGDRTAGDPVHPIIVRNDGTAAIKWMRVGAEDFFLVFDLPAGASLTLPCRRWGGAYGFGVEGEFQNGRRIERSRSVQADEPPRPVLVLVTDAGAAVSIQSP